MCAMKREFWKYNSFLFTLALASLYNMRAELNRPKTNNWRFGNYLLQSIKFVISVHFSQTVLYVLYYYLKFIVWEGLRALQDWINHGLEIKEEEERACGLNSFFFLYILFLGQEDEATLTQVRRLMQKITEMKEQRKALLDQFRSQLQNDDITNVLVTQETVDREVLHFNHLFSW